MRSVIPILLACSLTVPPDFSATCCCAGRIPLKPQLSLRASCRLPSCCGERSGRPFETTPAAPCPMCRPAKTTEKNEASPSIELSNSAACCCGQHDVTTPSVTLRPSSSLQIDLLDDLTKVADVVPVSSARHALDRPAILHDGRERVVRFRRLLI